MAMLTMLQQEEKFVLDVLRTYPDVRAGHLGMRKAEVAKYFRRQFTRRMLTDALLNRLVESGKVVAAAMPDFDHGRFRPIILASLPDFYVPYSYNPMLYLVGRTPKWCVAANGLRKNRRLEKLLQKMSRASSIE